MSRPSSTCDAALNLQPGLRALLPMTQLPGCMLPASQEWDGMAAWHSPSVTHQWVGLVTWSGLEKQIHVMGKNGEMGENAGKHVDGKLQRRSFKRQNTQARKTESWFRIWEEDYFGSSSKTTIYRVTDINLQGYEILGKKKMLAKSRCFKGCKGGDYHRETIWVLPLFWVHYYTPSRDRDWLMTQPAVSTILIYNR